jgi:acetyl-CoA synthetase
VNIRAGDAFVAARDQLLRLRDDPTAAKREFRWPELDKFNWACDYFDRLATRPNPALRVVNDAGADHAYSFAELVGRSNQVANFLRTTGLVSGDRVLVMLGNVVPLWETILGAMKLGAVLIPATTLLTRDDLTDRLERGAVRAIVTDGTLAARFAGLAGAPVRIAVGDCPPGWLDYAQASGHARVLARPPESRASDPLLLYFTSGTTARPKLVLHTQASYPVGHLSTMYWLGLQPGDVHLNLSSPGWAKHAWSSLFAPWNCGATVLAYQFDRFNGSALLTQLARARVSTFCAPPTVWRMLIQGDLGRRPVALREVTSAGEPLNPEVIAHVKAAWGLTIRDGFGQTETTAVIGNLPGQPLKPGSMGRPLPGYPVVLLDPDGAPTNDGEICLALDARPLGLMQSYLDDPEDTHKATRDGYYHTGDVASRDGDGYLTYVGRTDDVFKCSDYRISPFELESVLIEHPSVVEAAVVPSPDALRLAVPKAFVVLASGFDPDAATARAILAHVRSRVSPFKRVRRIEFADLPKTISGKIRRVELRQAELQRGVGERHEREFWEEDLHTPE